MFDKNWNMIIILLIIVLIIAYFRNCYEGFGGTATTINVENAEAIRNVASIYNKDNMTLSNLTTTGTITSNGDTKLNNLYITGIIRGNVPATGQVSATSDVWSAEGNLRANKGDVVAGNNVVAKGAIIYGRNIIGEIDRINGVLGGVTNVSKAKILHGYRGAWHDDYYKNEMVKEFKKSDPDGKKVDFLFLHPAGSPTTDPVENMKFLDTGRNVYQRYYSAYKFGNKMFYLMMAVGDNQNQTDISVAIPN